MKMSEYCLTSNSIELNARNTQFITIYITVNIAILASNCTFFTTWKYVYYLNHILEVLKHTCTFAKYVFSKLIIACYKNQLK